MRLSIAGFLLAAALVSPAAESGKWVFEKLSRFDRQQEPVAFGMPFPRGVLPAAGRFVLRDESQTADLADADLFALLQRIAAGHRWMHVEKLQEFDGQPGYTKAQGED